MTMSDSLPKPLPSINALRAHLKLLERGVNDARDKRVGPRPLAPAPIQRAPAARPQTNASGSYQIPVARSTEGSNGKPKAKPKTGADFGAFFTESEAKRAAS